MIFSVFNYFDMTEEAKESVDNLLDHWSIDRTIEDYIGWIVNDFTFNDDGPNSIDLDKMVIDEWLIENGAQDIQNYYLLIKVSDV